MANKRIPILENYIPVTESGCWIWMGWLCRGYGPYRLIYTRLRGPVPDGLQLDHLCRVRCCVNPDHLEPVTAKENIRRGETGKRNREKTHCNYGHEFTPENTMVYRGTRSCLQCRRDATNRMRRRKGIPAGLLRGPYRKQPK